MALQLLRRQGIQAIRPTGSRTLTTSALLRQNAPPSNSNSNPNSSLKSSGKINWAMERDKPDYTMKDLQTLVASYSLEQRHSFTEMEKEEKEVDPDIYKLVRPLREGDVIAPHHLSFQAYKKQTQRKRPGGHKQKDQFDKLNMDPLDHYKNFKLLQSFVTTMGRIKHGNVTGLNPRNQRRMAKAIRRAVGIGLLPSTHCHPEILRYLQDEEGRDMPTPRDTAGRNSRYSDANPISITNIFPNGMN